MSDVANPTDMPTDDVAEEAVAHPSPWQNAARRFIRQPAGIIGMVVLLVYLFAALFPSVIAPHDPYETFAGHELEGPSADHLFGTDPIGRDIFSRAVHSAPIAMKVGLIAVAIGLTVGGLSGFSAAFVGGRYGRVVMRFWDGMFSMPAILIGITLAAAIGSGVTAIALAIGIAASPSMARVSYGSGLQQMGVGYVESASALGLTRRRIFFLHLLPNALGPVLVQAALFVGVAVLLEAALSFLGVGILPPAPSWGSMLADSQQHLRVAWWYGLFPGFCIAGFVLGMNMIADATRDALDPRA